MYISKMKRERETKIQMKKKWDKNLLSGCGFINLCLRMETNKNDG